MERLGVLTLVESKNPPVFRTPMVICWDSEGDPHIGQSFLFSCADYPRCNTSEVKAIRFHSEQNIRHLVTRNSVYQLQMIEPVIKG